MAEDQLVNVVMHETGPDDNTILLTVSEGCCDNLPGLRIAAEDAETLAGMFKAISHPVRLQIVDLLSRYGGQVCVCDIEGHFELSQPTISHHLKILRQAELVESEHRGIWVYYHIRPKSVARLQTLLGEFKPETA
jgi:ArsR family transcriptional regulator, arsenate/arsenite/antimonite-responsive transcriptional repressor